MNEHKFYNEYVLPVLEEVKEELNKRGVDCYIRGNRLLQETSKGEKHLFTYFVDDGEYAVGHCLQHLFSNDFSEFGYTKELIFAPIKPKSIYDLTIGDEFYYMSYVSKIEQVRKCKITHDGYYAFYKERVKHGEAFLTEVECERALAKKEAVAKIKKRAYELQGDWKPDWKNRDEDKIYIKYDHHIKELLTFTFLSIEHIGICFRSKEVAKYIIEELPNELKLMLEVYDD